MTADPMSRPWVRRAHERMKADAAKSATGPAYEWAAEEIARVFSPVRAAAAAVMDSDLPPPVRRRFGAASLSILEHLQSLAESSPDIEHMDDAIRDCTPDDHATDAQGRQVGEQGRLIDLVGTACDMVLAAPGQMIDSPTKHALRAAAGEVLEILVGER